MDNVLEHIPLLMGLISFIGGAATWYGAAVRKRYASERDFGHLKKSYDTLASNVAHLDRMFDERLDQLQREQTQILTLFQAYLIRSGGDSSNSFLSND